MEITVLDFEIPSDKDELLQKQPGKYSVKDVLPIRMTEDFVAGNGIKHSKLQAQDSAFILEHFDAFFSVLVHGSNLKVTVHISAFEKIYKCFEIFVHELENIFEKAQEIPSEDKLRFISIAKMLVYLLASLTHHIEAIVFDDSFSERTKQNKKVPAKSDVEEKWYQKTDELLVLIYHLIQLPLEKLWQPPIADASFVRLIAEMCYRILERCKNAHDKHVRESIFQILGTLVQRYNYSMSCVIKIVQLVKMCDDLATHLATGIVQLIEQTGCTGIVKQVLREIERTTPEEGATRNIGAFLEGIATSKPQLILPVVNNLSDQLDNECHIMRNYIIGILGIVVQETLTSEELSEDEKTIRDDCLNILMDQMLDMNGYVRSKTLQVWQNLCSEGAVPLMNQNVLLEATIKRLNDKNVLVRKYAFQLLRTLLECNPFAGQFDLEKLTHQLTNAEKKLKTLKTKLASISKSGDNIRTEIWNSLIPSLREVTRNITVQEHKDVQMEQDADLDAAFESVRQLIFEEKLQQALENLIQLIVSLPESQDVGSMTPEVREQYLLSLLHKIFLESQEAEYATENHKKPDSDRAKEWEKEKQKREEEYTTQARLVKYVENCYTFANELAKAIPPAELRLWSVTASDAVEACTFLGIASQFEIIGARKALRKALRQVFYPNQSVSENLAKVYEQVYIGNNDQYKSERQRALTIVKVLIEMLITLEDGESPALAKLVALWRSTEIIGPEVLRVLWERFSFKLTDTSPEESRAALMLLTMAATTEPAIVNSNFDILLTVGLGPRADSDLLLARDTCRAVLKYQVQNPDPLKCPSRLSNDHKIFEKLLKLLTEKFTDKNELCYTTFSTEAINAIYHIADQPEVLMKQLLNELVNNFETTKGRINRTVVSSPLLINLLHIVGHIAIRQMIHMDIFVYNELKRRNTSIKEMKEKRKGNEFKRKSIAHNDINILSSASRMRRNKDQSLMEDSGEAALEGATAEDLEGELINKVLENELVSGKGLLTKFVPLVLNVCQHPEKYTDKDVQIAAALALSKMMTVSSLFCKEYLQLLITIMERSPYPDNRAYILVGVTDLMNRFPNVVEPWTKHIYGRLRDESPHVRYTCVKMLSNLIMREMIRVKGQVSELAICLADPEENIRQATTQLFNDIANKGNALYNIMPDILSRLTDLELNLEEDKFRLIINCILGLLKEKQMESIIEKICVRFKLATTERQWRNLAYCLSLLKFNARSTRRLIDNLVLMKEHIHYKPVLDALQHIIEQTKKKPEAKAAGIELEKKLDEMLTGDDKKNKTLDLPNDDEVMPPPAAIPRSGGTPSAALTPSQRKSKRLDRKRKSK